MMKTLDCTDIKAMLSALIDDEVSVEQRHAAERHLADCTACRDMLDRAEARDRMVAMQAEMATAALDARFEERVLARTVGLDDAAHSRWTNRVGWLAAAASLALAVGIWVMDRPVADDSGNGDSRIALDGLEREDATSRVESVANIGSVLRSWTYEGELPDPEVNPAPRTTRSTSALDDAESRSVEDKETLFATALVMRHLTNADLRTFNDIERIRQIAEYDELPSRLRELRSRMNAVERPAVMAAEALILRIVRGPLSMDDVQMMRRDASQLELAERLDAMAAQGAAVPSL